MYIHVKYVKDVLVLSFVRSAIDNTFKHAQEHNLIIRDAISGAEMVEVSVEKLRTQLDEEGSHMSQRIAGEYQASINL